LGDGGSSRYDPASIQQRTAITTGSGIEYSPKLNLLRVEALGKSVSSLEALCHTLPLLEGRSMKVRYDPRTDTLSVVLKDNTPVHESDEDKPGVILDYGKECNLISFEILDASKRVTDTRKVDFQLAE
jgi:uncharacterized protein YuzE